MHLADIIHGDLTTSNMMLRRPAFRSIDPIVTTELVTLANCSTLRFLLFPGPNRLRSFLSLYSGRRQSSRPLCP
jgi:hypothetical protein